MTTRWRKLLRPLGSAAIFAAIGAGISLAARAAGGT